MEKNHVPKVIYRSVEATEITHDEEKKTLTFAFSSETPYERWWGVETLSHDEGAMNLERLNDGAPLLFNHDMDRHIGVIERGWVGKDRRGYVEIRFASNALALEKKKDIEDKILRKVSFGYMIDDMVLSRTNDQGNDEWTVTKFTPFEVSFVTIPADNSVGLGRELEGDKKFEALLAAAKRSFIERTQKTAGAAPAKGEKMDPITAPAPDLVAVRKEAQDAERARVQTISAIGEKHGVADMAREFVANGKSADEFREAVLSKISVRQTAVSGTEADIGLSPKEVEQFSFLRAINALANPTNRRMQEAAKFEIEVSNAGAKARGKESQGIFVPFEILRAKRDLAKGTPSAGGYLVATEHRHESFIELLRKKSVLDRAGVTVLNGLVGDLAIPKQTGGATAYWVGEGGSPTESQPSFGQVAMAPKTVGAFTDITRKLALQSSPDAESLVKADLAKVLALAIDLAGLYGAGSSNQPAGLTTLVGSGLNTKDFAAAKPTFAELVEMETLIAADDADVEAMKYLIEPSIRGHAKTTAKFGSGNEATIWEPGNTINGYQTLVSNQIVAEDVFFGNWADLLIGYWSGLDLTVDTAALATSGGLRVIVLQDCDIAVRHAESFCWANDAQ